MAKPTKVEREAGYDPSPPRCAICIYHRTENVLKTCSAKERKATYCGKFHFKTKPEGLCDKWVGFDSTELEP